jgi:hypothetical protein
MNAYDEMTPVDRNTRMYGCDIEKFRESLEESFTFKQVGPAMCAMSLMSDAQEEMVYGNVESASKTLNRAKWIIGEYMMKERA